MRTKCVVVAIAVLLSLGIVGDVRANTLTYNAASDFSISSNPNGNWTYGYTPESGLEAGTLTEYTTGETVSTEDPYDVKVWHEPSFIDTGTYGPCIEYNAAGTYSKWSVDWTPGLLALCWSASNCASVMVWTAPAAGTCNVSAVFTALQALEGRDANCYISTGGSLTNLGLASIGAVSYNVSTGYGSQSYSNPSITVAEGDIIAFAVGGGLEATGLNATVTLTTIPEPSVMAILATGLFGLLAYAWRKRR